MPSPTADKMTPSMLLHDTTIVKPSLRERAIIGIM